MIAMVLGDYLFAMLVHGQFQTFVHVHKFVPVIFRRTIIKTCREIDGTMNLGKDPILLITMKNLHLIYYS